MSAFIKVERAIFETDIMSHPVAFRLLMLIKKEAIYKDEGVTVGGVHVGRGQWLRSYRNLSKDLEYKEGRGFKKPGLATVKRAIKRLIEYGLVSIRETDNGTLFTVAEAQENQAVERSEEQNAERLSERYRNDSGTLAEQDLRKKKVKEGKKRDNSRKRPVYDEDSPYIKMAKYFLNKVKEWKPDYVFRGSIQIWADDFRKIYELDKRSKEDIKAVIDWVTIHSFWQSNILSPKKLREKFDTLQAQMTNEQSGKVKQFPRTNQGGQKYESSWSEFNSDKEQDLTNTVKGTIFEGLFAK